MITVMIRVDQYVRERYGAHVYDQEKNTMILVRACYFSLGYRILLNYTLHQTPVLVKSSSAIRMMIVCYTRVHRSSHDRSRYKKICKK